MFPKEILQWFAARGITEDTIRHFGLHWDGSRIVIPVKDHFYKTLFNKYRRDPRTENGPKYSYDKGAKIALFNYQPEQKTVVICEGELDVMRLHELGVYAVSGTGGAGSFPEDWTPLFDGKDIYICYDNDPAGAMGTVKIATKLPEIRVISFPAYWMGKDITDFLQHHTKEEFERLMRRAYQLPLPKTKDVKEINRCLNACVDLRRTFKSKGHDSSTLIIDHVADHLNEMKLAVSQKKNKETFDRNITNVKDIPITNFIQFNMAGFAKCIWHSPDRSPSMKYYPETNTLYCFSCSHHGDVIAVIRQLQNKTFKEAVEFLQGNL